MTDRVAIDVHAIRRRAHELWVRRGCPAGTPELDWLEAERELHAESARAQQAATGLAPRGAISVATELPPPRRPRAPRSIVTRAGSAPAARLLVALVPEACPPRPVAVNGPLEPAPRRRR